MRPGGQDASRSLLGVGKGRGHCFTKALQQATRDFEPRHLINGLGQAFADCGEGEVSGFKEVPGDPVAAAEEGGAGFKCGDEGLLGGFQGPDRVVGIECSGAVGRVVQAPLAEEAGEVGCDGVDVHAAEVDEAGERITGEEEVGRADVSQARLEWDGEFGGGFELAEDRGQFSRDEGEVLTGEGAAGGVARVSGGGLKLDESTGLECLEFGQATGEARAGSPGDGTGKGLVDGRERGEGGDEAGQGWRDGGIGLAGEPGHELVEAAVE